MITVRKINDLNIKPLRYNGGVKDNRPFKGKLLFDYPYPNVYCVARKRSGKTVTIQSIIRNCATKETTLILFVSTVHKDPNWLAIVQWCEKHHVNVISFTSIHDEGVDVLEQLLTKFKHEEVEEETDEEDSFKWESEEEEKKREPKRPKYLAPKYIFVFDDISAELKAPSVSSLLKENRHLKAMTIISSQYLLDLTPQSRRQIEYALLFAGLNEEKLKGIYKDLDLSIDFDIFTKLYQDATKEKYSFLYVNALEDKFRIRFNKAYDLMD